MSLKKLLSCHIQNWAAWAPGLETNDDWLAYAKHPASIPNDTTVPDLSHLPPMFRRRLSQLSKLSIHVALQLTKESIPTIFSSRFGQIITTSNLLTKLHASETLSPAAFSMSVHNTTSGLNSIATKNTATSTAISGGQATLEATLTEAYGLLLDHPEVLVIIGEEKVPESYHQVLPDPPPPFCIGLLLSQSGTAPKLHMTHQPGQADAPVTNDYPALAFFQWLIQQPTTPLTLKSPTSTTTFHYD